MMILTRPQTREASERGEPGKPTVRTSFCKPTCLDRISLRQEGELEQKEGGGNVCL